MFIIMCVSIKAHLHSFLYFLRVLIQINDRNTRRESETNTKPMPRIKLTDSPPSLCGSGETTNHSNTSQFNSAILSSNKSINFVSTYCRHPLLHQNMHYQGMRGHTDMNTLLIRQPRNFLHRQTDRQLGESSQGCSFVLQSGGDIQKDLGSPGDLKC